MALRRWGIYYHTRLNWVSKSEAARAYEQKQEYENKEQNGAIILKNTAKTSPVCHSKTPPHVFAQ
jgi:hypothetical protein